MLLAPYTLDIQFRPNFKTCGPDLFDSVNIFGFGTSIDILVSSFKPSFLAKCSCTYPFEHLRQSAKIVIGIGVFTSIRFFRIFQLDPSPLPYEIVLDYTEDGFFHPTITLLDDTGGELLTSTTTSSPTILQFANSQPTTYFVIIKDEHAWFGTYSMRFSVIGLNFFY